MSAVVYPILIQRMVCTGCGAEANASCNCGVPYEVKLAAREADRQRKRRDREKAKQNQRSRPADRPIENIEEIMPTEEEAEESHQETLFDQACLFLERMTGATRQRFFAHLKEKYRVS